MVRKQVLFRSLTCSRARCGVRPSWREAGDGGRRGGGTERHPEGCPGLRCRQERPSWSGGTIYSGSVFLQVVRNTIIALMQRHDLNNNYH